MELLCRLLFSQELNRSAGGISVCYVYNPSAPGETIARAPIQNILCLFRNRNWRFTPDCDCSAATTDLERKLKSKAIPSQAWPERMEWDLLSTGICASGDNLSQHPIKYSSSSGSWTYQRNSHTTGRDDPLQKIGHLGSMIFDFWHNHKMFVADQSPITR